MESTERPHILVIEDNDANRYIIVKALSRLNGSVVEAKNGIEGLAACESQQFDLILCDLMMPEMDGRTFVSEFRALEHQYFTPILILTAIDTLDDKISLLDLGCDDYITKPFNHRELVAKANVLLRVSHLARALTDKSVELERLNTQILSLQEELLRKERLDARDSLRATALHTLRQPLTTAHLTCSLLERLLVTEDQKTKLSSLQSLLREMASHIDTLEKIDMDSPAEYVEGVSMYNYPTVAKETE